MHFANRAGRNDVVQIGALCKVTTLQMRVELYT